MTVYDLIIIGSGPGGLTAAIYAARYRLKLAVISKEIGGTAATASKVCNYPSYKEISGIELMNKMIEQVKDLDVPIIQETVYEIKKHDNKFEIKTTKNSYTAKKVIFAGGTERRKLGVKGEKELLGKGVSYCATCDAVFFKNKNVAVIGGSDAALTASLFLSEYADKVTIIYRKDKFFRAEPSWVKLVEKQKKIKTLFNEEVEEIVGKNKVEHLKLVSGKELRIDGVFIEIGSTPNLGILNNLKIKQERDYIITDKFQETNLKGFYAVGDITNNQLKQIITATAEGAVAANSVYKRLKEEE